MPAIQDIQEVYLEALDFAARKHGDQKVPGKGYSYVAHICSVAMEILVALDRGRSIVDGCLAVSVALLHDTMEDAKVTSEELKSSFGESVEAGVRALTKNSSLPKEERMADSIRRILDEPREVGMVKLADRITNLQPPPPHWDREKRAAYLEESRMILASLGACDDFLASRLQKKISVYPV